MARKERLDISTPSGKQQFYQESGLWDRFRSIWGQAGESNQQLAARTGFWEKYHQLSDPQVRKLQERNQRISEGRPEPGDKPLTSRQKSKIAKGNRLLVDLYWKTEDDDSLPGDTPKK